MHRLLARVHWTNKPDELSVKNDRVSVGFIGTSGATYEGHFPQQLHGVDIVEAGTQTENGQKERLAADGIYTHQTSCQVAVQTADCLPVLIYSLKNPFVMALHCGWRGLSSGIIKKALLVAREHSLFPQELAICMGPAISLGRFEVGEDVFEAFRGRGLDLDHEQLAYILHKGREDRWHIDLASAAVFSLTDHGVEPENISVLRSCSYDNDQLWYSFRRSGEKTGRIWSWISHS